MYVYGRYAVAKFKKNVRKQLVFLFLHNLRSLFPKDIENVHISYLFYAT